MKVNQITTFVVTPEQGMVFKKAEWISSPEDKNKMIEQISYVTSVNLSAQSEAQAREIVSSLFTQVDISEKEAYDAEQAEQSANENF